MDVKYGFLRERNKGNTQLLETYKKKNLKQHHYEQSAVRTNNFRQNSIQRMQLK